jgi:glycosyltransferase involved in cell wall biosynthesis
MPRSITSQTLVIIPVYDEVDRVRAVVDSLRGNGFVHIVAIDDGSKDGSLAVLQKIKDITVLEHSVNRGTGAATQTGINWGLTQKFQYFATIDADGQHFAQDLQRVTEGLSGASFVLGSRFLGDSSTMPFWRQTANKVANLCTGILFGVWVSDSQSGLRAFTREVAEKMHLKSDGFEFCSACIREVDALGFVVKEVPIRVTYTAATMHKGQNFAAGLKTLGKLFLRAMTR